MIELFSKFIAVGLAALIAFFVISFLINVVALRIGAKSAKPETGTWPNALKAVFFMFLVSIALSALSAYLQTLSLGSEPGTMQSVYGGLASLLGLFALVANIWIIKKIFELTGGETVKAVIVTVIVDGLLHAVLIGIFVVLFFGTFFKMAVKTLPTPSTGSTITAEISKPRLPKLPTASDSTGESMTEGKTCENSINCNKIDELCLYGICQSLDNIKQTFGFTDDTSFDPCLTRPCPNCKSGFQYLSSISYLIDNVNLSALVCIDCLFEYSCNEGFRCQHLQCVDIATYPDCHFSMDCGKGYKCENKLCVKEASSAPSAPLETPSASPEAVMPTETTPPPTSIAPSADSESLKRDDERIGKLDEAIAFAKTLSPAELPWMIASSNLDPCWPSGDFPFQLKTFSFGTISCDTTYFKDFADGFVMLIGIENASKANLDTRKIPSIPPSSAKDISSLLGSVSPDTPSENMAYAEVFEKSAAAQP